MQQAWEAFKHEVKAKFPQYCEFLNQGADERQVQQLEAVLGYALPDAVKALYQLNDGEAKDGLGFFYGLRFLPLAEIAEHWLSWQDIIVDGLEGLNDYCTSTPDNAIQKVYANQKWIPLLYDWGGNHLGVDLDPDRGGTWGQIINFGRDEDEKYVLAENLAALLEIMTEKLRAGTEIHVDAEGYYSLNGLHFLDALKNIARARDAA